MSYQQTPQGYSQPLQPQPLYPQPPKRRSKTWLWIIALVVVFFMGIGVGSGTHSDTSATSTDANASSTTNSAPSTSVPTAAVNPLAWKTTHTFTGNGTKKTETFTVADTWKLQWKCTPASFDGQYNVIVAVTNSDGTPSDPAAVNTLCKAGNTSDTTTEHQGGNVYLDVTSEGAWTLTVQEQK